MEEQNLNHKYLRSDVKANVVLTAIRLSDEDVEPGDPLGAFEKSRLMAPGFSFTLPHLIFITHT
jgi:hypothetical protein